MKFVQISERDKIRENLFWNVRKNWYREKRVKTWSTNIAYIHPFIKSTQYNSYLSLTWFIMTSYKGFSFTFSTHFHKTFIKHKYLWMMKNDYENMKFAN